MNIDVKDWEIELQHMRSNLYWVLETLDEINQRHHVRHRLQQMHSQLTEILEAITTKGGDE